ncbi:cadherin domain-containing protein [Novosphingobium sp.]|uniref:cadherin domain-containing protein n=1 Tax=Novosphingobium sp. TaxID=1874826 RepID=UPI00262A7599|nr:cadherin domain-containing protein [Novosphingobium sp.]
MRGVIRSGSEFLVNTQTDNIQSVPKLTELADGRFVVTWTDFSKALGDGSGTSLKAQLFQSDGTRIGSEFLVNTEVKGSQSSGVVAALDGGGFVIAWVDESATLGDNSPFSIKAQMFGANGAKVGAEFLVNTVTSGSQVMPSIAALSGGGFVVSWRDGSETLPDTNTGHIKAQVFKADGSKAGGEFLVNTITEGDQRANTMAPLKNGGFVVAWVDDIGPLDDPTSFQIKAQIFAANGTKVGGEFAVSTAAIGVQLFPSITMLKNGNFVVAWNDTSGSLGDTGGWAVNAQIFAPDGTRIGSEFLVNTVTTGSQFAPSIAGLADGGFVVSWHDDSRTLGDASGTSIKAQAFAADGSRVGSEFRVNTEILGNQQVPNVAALGQGFGIAWIDSSRTLGDASSMSIKAQLFGFGSIPAIVSGGGGDSAVVAVKETALPVAKVKATDADPGTALTYTIAGGADANRFQIDTMTGALSFKVAPDFERPRDAGADNVYSVIVKASDGQLFDTQALTVTVVNVNEAPAITSGGGKPKAIITAQENTVVVTTVTAADPDAGALLRYAIVGGADAGLFRINAQTGALTFRAAPDYEAPGDAGQDNVYDVVVRASDGRLSDTQTLAIRVTDLVNEIINGTSGSDTLSGAGGHDTISGAAGNDTLLGKSGNDVLDGGTGADRMDGGAGNDIFIVDSSGDVVIEGPGGGTDTVKASVSYTLGADLDNLTLLGGGNLAGKGNALANTLGGNEGDNTLTGFAGDDSLIGGDGGDTLSGGLGRDVLTGGSGRDFFVFDSVPGAANADIIADFNGAENDKIQLSRAIFQGFAQEGALSASQFYAAAGARSAQDASDRIIYDTTSGKLYHDADGMGGAAAVLIAVLGSSNHPTLIYSDIQIIA